MADALGVSQPTIWRWLNQSKQMPAEYVLLTEGLTGVNRHDLRPDIYPRETMTDRHVGQRFEGVDAHVVRFPLHGAEDTRVIAHDHFNRASEMKTAR